MVTELFVGAERWPALIESLARFSRVEGDHLVRIIEVGPDLGATTPAVYLASEVGSALPNPADTIRGHGDRARAVTLVGEVARGVHALHEAGVVHGRIDVWSALGTAHGGAIWPPPLDDPPGLSARFVDWRSVVCVDPALLRGITPTRWSDVWSLGALLHGALTDRPLYPGIEDDDPVSAVRRVLETPPEVDPAVPEPLAGTIASCLRPDPAERPVTAEQLAETLTEGSAREGSATT
jgi:hypothetical protein